MWFMMSEDFHIYKAKVLEFISDKEKFPNFYALNVLVSKNPITLLFTGQIIIDCMLEGFSKSKPTYQCALDIEMFVANARAADAEQVLNQTIANAPTDGKVH